MINGVTVRGTPALRSTLAPPHGDVDNYNTNSVARSFFNKISVGLNDPTFEWLKQALAQRSVCAVCEATAHERTPGKPARAGYLHPHLHRLLRDGRSLSDGDRAHAVVITLGRTDKIAVDLLAVDLLLFLPAALLSY